MTRSVSSLVAALAAVLACATVPAAASARLRGSERAVIRQINGIRAQNGLPRVHASGALSRAAAFHSGDMLQNDFFDHTSSDGTSFDRRIRRYSDADMVGETLAALGQRHGGGATIVQMWMDSPPHRAILLTAEFRRIGIARRWGDLGGAGQAVVTADFASRG
jgi:uncharacterized protein YkwD